MRGGSTRSWRTSKPSAFVMRVSNNSSVRVLPQVTVREPGIPVDQERIALASPAIANGRSNACGQAFRRAQLFRPKEGGSCQRGIPQSCATCGIPHTAHARRPLARAESGFLLAEMQREPWPIRKNAPRSIAAHAPEVGCDDIASLQNVVSTLSAYTVMSSRKCSGIGSDKPSCAICHDQLLT
jgi:hypothetical protein